MTPRHIRFHSGFPGLHECCISKLKSNLALECSFNSFYHCRRVSIQNENPTPRFLRPVGTLSRADIGRCGRNTEKGIAESRFYRSSSSTADSSKAHDEESSLFSAIGIHISLEDQTKLPRYTNRYYLP